MPCDYKGIWNCTYAHTNDPGTKAIHTSSFDITIEDVPGSNGCRVVLPVINDANGDTEQSFNATPSNNKLTGTVQNTKHHYTFTLEFSADKRSILDPSSKSRRTRQGEIVEPPQPTDIGTITGTKG